MTPAATCALHFDAASIATCARCGRFCCSTCWSNDGLCPECRARVGAALPALEERANFAVWALYVAAAMHAAQILAGALQLASGQVGEEDMGPAAMFAAFAALGYLPVFIATIVLVCRWFHLAVRHAQARGAPIDASPASAVGSWFIPFVNLVKPFNIARELLNASTGAADRVTAWQVLWFIGNMAGNAGARLPDAGGVGVNLVSDALLFGAALCAVRVIRGVRFDQPQ